MQNPISDTIIIRKFREQDLEQILNIENQVAIDPWTREAFIGCAKVYSSVVAVNPDVIGYGVIAIYASINEAHILNLAVDQIWQGAGVGASLLNYLIELCHKTCGSNNSKIFLEVHKDNLAAINLYKKFNFVEVGIRKNYYKTKYGKQDALVLVLDV